MYSKNIAYIPSLDHVRGYAALLIMLYHSTQLITRALDNGTAWFATDNPLLALVVEGHTAVALFMVLSGFIFTWGNKGRTIRYSQFLKNRLLRIAPLMVVLVVVGIYTFPANYTFVSLLQTILFQANLPGSLSLGGFSSMFWTISVEFLFYLIFPWMLVFFDTKGLRYGLGIIALSITMRYLAVLHGANPRDISYWTIVGRIDQFTIGMALGYLFTFAPEHSASRKLLTFCGSFALLLGIIFGFHKLGGWPVDPLWKIFWPPIEGCLWALVLACYMRAASLIPALLSRVLSAVGRISYSLYLTHFIVITMLIDHDYLVRVANVDVRVNTALNTLFLVIPLTFALATLTYKVVEEPFLSMRVKYT